jgi:hypothetical protein
MLLTVDILNFDTTRDNDQAAIEMSLTRRAKCRPTNDNRLCTNSWGATGSSGNGSGPQCGSASNL